MYLAVLVSYKSKDPNTQVGSVLVDRRNCVIGVGFNGMPQGVDDTQLPWDRSGSCELDRKYLFVCHSESNALDFCDHTRLDGSRLYVTLYPCAECSKRVIQNRVSEVVYLSDQYHDTESCQAARKMFDLAGVKYRQFIPPTSLTITA